MTPHAPRAVTHDHSQVGQVLVGVDRGSAGVFGSHFQGSTLEPAQNLGSGPKQGWKWIQHPQNGSGGVDTPSHALVGVSRVGQLIPNPP